ncbi:hypothetical protein DFH09DRAFT_926194 [Mycena vulgaris]|nr:hypothetical protein DFH09DRAFT_926194 [Mycena vulgaris]
MDLDPASGSQWSVDRQPRTQQPTCTNLRIRSVHEANKIFYAIRRGVLRMVTRRLDSVERAALRTGFVYAWEERQGPNPGIGLERWSDSRRWGPSRVWDGFLFYSERPSSDPIHGDEPIGWEQLVKQTYSAFVETETGRMKWHLIAYFTKSTVDQLGTVDDIADVRDLEIPAGMFTSARAGKGKNIDNPMAAVLFSSPTDSERRSLKEIGSRCDLAPLNSLTGLHSYRRDPTDEKMLRLLGPCLFPD